MLKDRVVLIAQEIDKMKLHCSQLYRSSAIQGDRIDKDEYTRCLDELSTMIADLVIIKDMINNGQE